MAKKIEVQGNFLVTTDTITGLEISRLPSANVTWNIYSDSLHIIYVNRYDQNYNLKVNELVDENGNEWENETVLKEWLSINTGGYSLTDGSSGGLGDSFIKVDLATNDLGRDAWGRPKAVLDNSIFHGMFTYNVPVTTWQETINGTIQSTFTNATSVNGALNLTSGATTNDITELKTFRNPRYEPNRGHLYSTALFLPNPTATGVRSWGYFTAESGAFFSLVSGSLFAVVRTTLDGVTTDDSYLIDTEGIDLSKGNTYDIQMQWRGVGNYMFYIDLTEVKIIEYLGTRTELSTFNPANPLCFQCKNLGDEVLLKVGCVDVTSEGGKENGKTYGSITIENEAGEVDITGFNQPIIALRSKLKVGSRINTRDTLALLASAYAEEKAMLRIWHTRDFTAINEGNQTYQDYGDGHLEYISRDTTSTMTFDPLKAKLIFGCRVNKDSTYSTSAMFEGRTEIYITPGDMYIFTMHRENGTLIGTGVTFEFAEEI